jgi:hypothetical protein
MRANNPKAILMGEGWEMLSSQILDAGWVWVPPANPEVFRYALPWAGAATAVDVDIPQTNRCFVLGLHLAIVARGLENGKKLSDFPEFAQHMAHLASFRERTKSFWIDGTFQDDLGIRVSGAFGKVYQAHDEVALMIANLTDETANVVFELDGHHYGIAIPSHSTISSSQRNEEDGKATEKGTRLAGIRDLAPYEVVALVFKRKIPEITA